MFISFTKCDWRGSDPDRNRPGGAHIKYNVCLELLRVRTFLQNTKFLSSAKTMCCKVENLRFRNDEGAHFLAKHDVSVIGDDDVSRVEGIRFRNDDDILRIE